MPNREKKDSWVKQLAGGMVGREEVGQHPGDHGRGVEHPQPGEVAQEEVRGRVQGSVGQGEEDDQRVAQQSDQVDQKHPPRTEGPGGNGSMRTPAKQTQSLLCHCPLSWPQGQTGRGSGGGSLATTEAHAAAGKVCG